MFSHRKRGSHIYMFFSFFLHFSFLISPFLSPPFFSLRFGLRSRYECEITSTCPGEDCISCPTHSHKPVLMWLSKPYYDPLSQDLAKDEIPLLELLLEGFWALCHHIRIPFYRCLARWFFIIPCLCGYLGSFSVWLEWRFINDSRVFIDSHLLTLFLLIGLSFLFFSSCIVHEMILCLSPSLT